MVEKGPKPILERLVENLDKLESGSVIEIGIKKVENTVNSLNRNGASLDYLMYAHPSSYNGTLGLLYTRGEVLDVYGALKQQIKERGFIAQEKVFEYEGY